MHLPFPWVVYEPYSAVFMHVRVRSAADARSGATLFRVSMGARDISWMAAVGKRLFGLCAGVLGVWWDEDG